MIMGTPAAPPSAPLQLGRHPADRARCRPRPRQAAISSVTASTVSSFWAAVSTAGLAVKRPSTSVSSTSRSASISEATRALRLSLSPTLISSTATVSFSLTIGSTPKREQGQQRVARVQVARAIADVLRGQQHWPTPRP
jgi:hypothetical protein